MSSVKICACEVSGASSMMTSAHLVASAAVMTLRPASSAFARDLEPSRRPIATSTPESRRLSECACPCEPYPMTATLRPWISDRSAESS